MTTHTPPTDVSPLKPPAPPAPEHACEECQSPLDVHQRYCVVCGARNRNAASPAAEYFSSAGRRRRVSAPPARQKRGWLAGNAPLLLFAILPVAVAIGVLVGKSGGGSTDEAKVLAALRNVAPAAATTANGSGTDATVASTAITSDFSLSKGYTVKLSTVPAKGATSAGVASAEKAARAKGAGAVGVIAPADFKTKPAQGSSYVIYSGEFKTRAAATKALGKLRKSFPHAQVIQVTAAGSAATSGRALSSTKFGTAHQVAGSKATKQQVQQDTKLVKKLSQQTGKSYVQQQQSLPDKVTIGGSGDGSPAPTNAGD